MHKAINRVTHRNGGQVKKLTNYGCGCPWCTRRVAVTLTGLRLLEEHQRAHSASRPQ